MGNCFSRRERDKRDADSERRDHRNVQMTANNRNANGMSERTMDEMEVAKLKKELEERPEEFVLNNLLMSVMFFDNFVREHEVFTEVGRNIINKELQSETVECIIPDVILETVHKNVRFRRLHGANKNKVEPIVPRRIFVMSDNIEVLENNNQYSAIDKPAYYVVMEDSKHPGFCKLRCAPNQARRIIPADTSKEHTPGPSTKTDDSENYEYSTLANINTPKPLEITSCERRDTLPQSCFVRRDVKKYEENKQPQEQPEDKPQFFKTVSYVSSKGFMIHFQNAVFPNSLAPALRFDLNEIRLAKAIPGTIFCNLQDVDNEFGELPCEIVPAVSIQWPIDYTWEFHSRADRPTVQDNFGNRYRWPRQGMLTDIRGLNCVLVPKGCIPKRNTNEDCDIEWEIAFPKAQRYLDTHMSHTQIRTFLCLVTLFKSHVELDNKRYDSVLVDHLRTHMYYEIEQNPKSWAAHKMGTGMITIMRKFNEKLARRHLSDFFIEKKNTFENVPFKYLTHVQQIFHNVLESPVVFFIGALRNLIYINSKFYPQLDFAHLHYLVTCSDSELFPKNHVERPPNFFPKTREVVKVQGSAEYQKDKEWERKRELENRQKVLDRNKKRQDKEENLKIQRRGSVESIDYQWRSTKTTFQHMRNGKILRFFIKHFIEMGKSSRVLATQRQALFYFKQAFYLTRLLELVGLQEDARDFKQDIIKEEAISKKLSVTQSSDLPPSTPSRNSTPINAWDVNQQVRGTNINLNNLNISYNSTSVPATRT